MLSIKLWCNKASDIKLVSIYSTDIVVFDYISFPVQLHVSALDNGHYQAPKHVVVLYVENTLFSTNKYSCVRPVHTLYISYFMRYNGDDELHDVESDYWSKSNKIVHLVGPYYATISWCTVHRMWNLLKLTMKMEALCISETWLAIYQSTRRNIPDNFNLHVRQIGNL